jgi:hypothetical protein
VLAQRVEQAHTRLNPQLARLAVDGQRDRPGLGSAFDWRRDNVRIHQNLLVVQAASLPFVGEKRITSR